MCKRVMIRSTFYLVFSLLLLASLWTNCSLIGGGTNTSTFIVEVDSINVPSEVASTDTLIVRPFGTVGTNGCHSFKQFEASQTPSSLDLQVIGEVVEGDDIGCTDEIVKLDTTYEVPPPLEGPFEITIPQPDETTLTRTVTVKD